MIKVILISNYLSLHQIDICSAFIKNSEVDFTFVSSFGPSGFKKDISTNYEFLPFVIRAYEDKTAFNIARKASLNADLVIIGSGDNELIKDRKGIIFRYSEHFSKKRILFLLKAISVHFRYRNERKNGFLLCASSYSKSDFNFAGLYRNKCLYYGYFPQLKTIDRRTYRNDVLKILWVGRGIYWKHPEVALKTALFLKQKGVKFHMDIISEENKLIISLKKKYDYLSEVVCFHGKMTNEEVLRFMKEADIYLFTSDRQEGWGVVLNEAMASGCCCFASSLAGSTKFLIRDGENGFIYNSFNNLKQKIMKIINNPGGIEAMSKKAIDTIANVWNAQTATNNIVKVFKTIVSDEAVDDDLINNGPGTFIK